MIKKYHVSKNLLDWSLFADNYFLDNTTGLPTAYTTSPTRIATTSPIDVSNYNNVTFSFETEATVQLYIYSLFNGNTLVRRVANNSNGSSIDTSQGDKLYLCIYSTSNITTSNVTNAMLNEGTTAKAYEPYGNTWNTIPYKKYENATDTITSLPQTIIGDGQPISAWSMKGNMSQSGTPTPSNPVYPQEVGEKTANLFDYTSMIAGGVIGSYLNSSGDLVSSSNWRITDYIPCDGNEFTLNKIGGNTPAICLYDENKQFITGKSYNSGGASTKIPVTVSTSATAKYIRFSYYNSDSGGDDVSKLMLSEGSEAMNFEPYGMYKIPISFNQTTYNIYISEPLRKSLDGSNVYDTIESNGTLTRRVDANGDALATPTTEQVTVPTLTTTGTPEQFNVLTTLAPSEVSLTYHGWHEHQDTKFTT